jgi:hypothetical protein
MRVRTDENVHVQTRPGVIVKTVGGAVAETRTTKENPARPVPTRPMAGKAVGGLKGGAKRAVLGDISNAGMAKVNIRVWAKLIKVYNNHGKNIRDESAKPSTTTAGKYPPKPIPEYTRKHSRC